MIRKQKASFGVRRLSTFLLLAGGATVMHAQVKAQPPSFPVPGSFTPTGGLQLPQLPVTTAITPNGAVVEDVIARVNDRIITRSEYERAQQQLLQEAQQQNVSATEFQDRAENQLRDMIDQQLLISKGKELGISGDAETMRQLDDIRKQNHLNSMEDLEKAAGQQGVSFEDFKQRIRNQVIQQQVVREEVGRRLGSSMTHAQEEAYYNEHKSDFTVPEQIHLSEILVPTPESASDTQVSSAQLKADELEKQLKGGAAFADVAKKSSGGPTAPAGGDLGDFKRGALGDVLEKATFSLPTGAYTEPIRTRQGFVILKVDHHQQAGVPPFADVEPQVQEGLYMSALQPALRAYLTKARDEAYVDVKPGFVDTGSNRVTGKPLFTTYTPPPVKKKIVKHQAAEQAKAVKAQEKLSEARSKVAEKNAQKAAAKNGGVVDVSARKKAPKIRREKVRYGQAPRNALPPALPGLAEASENPPLVGQAPGAAMGGVSEATTTISTGTGVENEDPLAPKVVATKKSRIGSRHTEETEKHAEVVLAKAEVKAAARPLKATTTESADEKQQAAPLGLNGDTTKKKTKQKRVKGEPKERIQEKAKPAETAPVTPTVNRSLGSSPLTAQPGEGASPTKPSADTTTLPPADTPAPGALPAGQPIPATTGTSPNAPSTTPTPR